MGDKFFLRKIRYWCDLFGFNVATKLEALDEYKKHNLLNRFNRYSLALACLIKSAVSNGYPMSVLAMALIIHRPANEVANVLSSI